MILVDAQRTDIPYTLDISLYNKEVIAKKYSSRFLEPIEQYDITSKRFQLEKS